MTFFPLRLTHRVIGATSHRLMMTDQSPLPHREIVVHFDGSCLGNPGPGGWAAHLEDVATGKRRTLSGSHLGVTTNGRMELAAAFEALRAVKAGAEVTMVGDSTYVINGASTWLPKWMANGWKGGRGGVANVDLWKEMHAAMQRHLKVTWAWQKGHVGHPLNELVDQLAKREALRRQKYPLQDDRVAHGELPYRATLNLSR